MCRNKHNLCVRHIRKSLSYFIGKLINRFVILFNSIPFIYGNYHTFSSVMSNSCNFCILLCYTFCGINHHNHHICSFYSSYRTNNAISLQFFFNLVFSTKTCCVNKSIFFSLISHLCINSISGSSCNVRNNDSIFS